MNWITSRIKEKSSQGGVALIAMGLVVIFLGSFVNIAAYAAMSTKPPKNITTNPIAIRATPPCEDFSLILLVIQFISFSFFII